jgi:hypothetical protein
LALGIDRWLAYNEPQRHERVLRPI